MWCRRAPGAKRSCSFLGWKGQSSILGVGIERRKEMCGRGQLSVERTCLSMDRIERKICSSKSGLKAKILTWKDRESASRSSCRCMDLASEAQTTHLSIESATLE
ncbi:UNVERIFIED_CONTAM: hypothetical protein Slati_4521500 [Sesamum latifolium]|uniref:Uncharacterized protein n=1 Tax=Sesamum latifolium TaxID=2727402 RepID=A0AAW2SGJ7_9LAMI